MNDKMHLVSLKDTFIEIDQKENGDYCGDK